MARGVERWRCALLVLAAAAAACGKATRGQPKPGASVVAPSSASAPAPALPPALDSGAAASSAAAAAVLSAWTRALNERDLAALERLYADRVQFYGRSLTRAEVLTRKRQALAATPTFTQSVLGAPSLEPQGELTRITFHKRSGPKGKERDVFASLVLQAKAPGLIVEETDAVTEKRARPAATAESEPGDCDSAVWALVGSTRESAKLYARIDENLKQFPGDEELSPGGMGPMTPRETGDGTYQIALGVHHTDRFEGYGWFTITAAGKVILTADSLDLDGAEVSPSPEALREFRRLCAAK